MKWHPLLLLTTLSGPLAAQSICGKEIKQEACEFQIRGAIVQNQNDELGKILKKNGLKPFFEFKMTGGPYRFAQMAQFFHNTGFFKVLDAQPGYPQDIPDKNLYLRAVLSNVKFTEADPVLISMLFNHPDKKKNLNWFENPEWPYPLLSHFKDSADKTKSSSLFKRMDQIDSLKKNVCDLKTVEEITQKESEYPGFSNILRQPGSDLLSCAVKSQNIELVAYLLDKNLFPSKSLIPLVDYIEAHPVTKGNFEFLKAIESKMKELKIPLPYNTNPKQMWVMEHLQDCDVSSVVDMDDFNKISEKLIWSALLKEVENLKTTSDKNKSIKNIVEIIRKSDFPVNFQDEKGKTLMHYLAAFSNYEMIEKVEEGLNDDYHMMDYDLQDKEGNTPLHIALINHNVRGSLALADNIVNMKQGFMTGSRDDVKMKNLKGEKPLDLARDLKPTKDEREDLKTIERWIKEHINPRGRFST